MAAPPTTSQPAVFDYQAELQKISQEVETTLQAKFDAAFAKMQKSISDIEDKVDQKLQRHIDQLKETLADKATQENHSKQLETLMKMLKILVHQINSFLDQNNHPMPMNGIGES